MSFTFLLTFLLVLPWETLAAGKGSTCYSPNGAATTITGGSLAIPLHACPAGPDGFSNCCAEGDTCSPDRLCYNSGGNSVWRNFCTDPTWKSGSCSPLCQDTEKDKSGPVQVTPCSDGMMCCGGNNTECCNAHAGTYAFNGVPINATTSATSNTVTLTGGEIGGIVVGAIAILLLTAVLILLILRFKGDRRPKRIQLPKEPYSPEIRAHIVSPTSAVHYQVPSLHSHPSVKSSHMLQRMPTDKSYSGHHVDKSYNYPSDKSFDRHAEPRQPYQYPMERSGTVSDRERPLPALPRVPPAVHELGGGEGVSRFEVSGRSVWGDKKY